MGGTKHRCARVLSVSGLSLCLLCAAPPQAVAPQGNSEALFVCLGALASPSQVQLDGFKSRALRSAEALPQRHLYVTVWHHVEVSCGAGAAVLVIGDWTSACCQACVVQGSDVTRPLAAVVGTIGDGRRSVHLACIALCSGMCVGARAVAAEHDGRTKGVAADVRLFVRRRRVGYVTLCEDGGIDAARMHRCSSECGAHEWSLGC